MLHVPLLFSTLLLPSLILVLVLQKQNGDFKIRENCYANDCLLFGATICYIQWRIKCTISPGLFIPLGPPSTLSILSTTFCTTIFNSGKIHTPLMIS